MSFQLLLRVQTSVGLIERTFPRFPVFIGRKVGAGHFNIRDPSASKLHASIDVRDGQIWIRDASSTNGTFVRNHRIPPNQWTSLGGSLSPAEFQVGDMTFQAEMFEDDEVSSTRTLGAMLDRSDEEASERRRVDVQAQYAGGHPSLPRMAPELVYAETSTGENDVTNVFIASLAGVYQGFSGSNAELRHYVADVVQATRPEDRRRLCQKILTSYPLVAYDPELRGLLAENGVAVPPTDREGAAANAALASLRALALWYTGRKDLVRDPSEVSAFALRLQTTLDDFLLGYVPLLSGLSRFEDQLAIHGPSSTMARPDSAADLAASLLDWTRDDTEARARVKASLAELMMHQVALLRGVMRGVKALLTELSPAVIEQMVERDQSGGALGRMFSRLDPWSLYKQRHSDLADEENERFGLLFGSDFVDEYRQFVNEARAAGDASGTRRGG
jgi:type VI secretion system protein ImpI